jgi:hypothetical protein
MLAEVCEGGKVKLVVYEMDKNRSKNTPSLLSMVLHKIQGTGLCSCGLLYGSTVWLLSQNFTGFPLYFPIGIWTQTYRNPTFLFWKVSTQNFGNSGSFFAFLFRLIGILKLAAILVEFWREIVVPVRVLLIESSPRFTNRVQSAVLLIWVQSTFYHMPIWKKIRWNYF